MKIVRWLGAFGKGSSLEEALLWELTHNTREVAADWGVGSDLIQSDIVARCRIGLLIPRTAVIRLYEGDVWSVTDPITKRLMATRYGGKVTFTAAHQERRSTPIFTAIVLRDKPKAYSEAILDTIRKVSEHCNIPVVQMGPSASNKWRRVQL